MHVNVNKRGKYPFFFVMPHHTRQGTRRIPAEALLGVWPVYHHHRHQPPTWMFWIQLWKETLFFSLPSCKLVLMYVYTRIIIIFLKDKLPHMHHWIYAAYASFMLKTRRKIYILYFADMLMISHIKTRFISFIIVSRLYFPQLETVKVRTRILECQVKESLLEDLCSAWWSRWQRTSCTWNYIPSFTMIPLPPLHCIVSQNPR